MTDGWWTAGIRQVCGGEVRAERSFPAFSDDIIHHLFWKLWGRAQMLFISFGDNSGPYVIDHIFVFPSSATGPLQNDRRTQPTYTGERTHSLILRYICVMYVRARVDPAFCR